MLATRPITWSFLLAMILPAWLVSPVHADDRETIAAVDAALRDAWKAKGLKPSRDCTDREYLRRVYLDIAGRIPTVAEVERFEQDKAADKRVRLVDALLQSDDYVKYWAERWSDWLLMPPGPRRVQVVERKHGEVAVEPVFLPPRLYREQLQLWLENELSKPDRGFDQIVRELLTSSGANNESGAVVFLLTHLGDPIRQHWQKEEGHFDMVPATQKILRVFLGYRMEGLPHQEMSVDGAWTVQKFWAVNAFLRQVQRIGEPARRPGMVPPLLRLLDDPQVNPSAKVTYHVDLDPMAAEFIDGRTLPADRTEPRRAVLARYVVSHPHFARVYVNRMWGHFFGRGFHERPDVDDFGPHHETRHGALLRRLARDFKKAGHNPRTLIRWICASQAYQRACIHPTPDQIEESEQNFAQMPLKALSAYQLRHSLRIILSTRKTEGEEHDPRRWEAIDRAIGEQLEDGTAEEIGPALWLMNSKELQQLIAARGEDLVKQAREDESATVKTAFRLVLGRPPSDAELKKVAADAMPVLQSNRKLEDVAADVLWALLQSSEFNMNH